MHITVVGMNHRTAPIALRERLAVPEKVLEGVLRGITRGNGLAPAECAVLSTCNRFEVYAVVPHPDEGLQVFNRVAREVATFSLQDVQDHVYTLSDAAAVRHLCRVAAGLDSMVLGESQILGQVVAAYELAQRARATGPLLSRLFQQAIHVGKRVRRETSIGQAPASVGSAAVHLLSREVPDLPERRVLVVGAGTMARTAARYLHDLGVSRLAIVNRTLQRGHQLATEVRARAYPWELLPVALQWADVVIVATAAPGYIVDETLLQQARAETSPPTLTIVDISVPRNVHPRVADLPFVRLFDIDDLRHIVDEGLALRRQAIPAAEYIIEAAVEEFTRWWRARSVAPTIAALYAHAEAVRQEVLTRTLRRLPPDASPEEVAEAVSRFLVDKLLQVPARNLRTLALNGDVDTYQAALTRLFELECTPPEGGTP